MPSYKRPGVYAEEVLNPSAALTTPNSGIAAFIAANPRGPVVPTLVESWSQFLRHFGGFGGAADYLPYALHQYYSNGGRAAWVTRVVGPNAQTATRTFADEGAAVDTLTVNAASSGAWGQDVYISIDHFSTDRFHLTVRYGGDGDANIVERWTELSMDDNDSRYAVNLINAASGGSAFIRVADEDSVTAAPGDRPDEVLTPQALVGGDDPAVTTDELNGAQELFDTVPGPLTINMPGVSDSGVLASLLTYCANRGDCFAVLDSASGLDSSGAVAAAQGLNSAYGAYYYPWIHIVDPATSAQGALKMVPPGGAVVGQYARTDMLRGVHKAPAGIDNRISGAVTVERKLTNIELDSLNTGMVNAIRHMPGVGVAIMGARTLRPIAADRFVSTRRTLNYIRSALVVGTQWAVFEPNDQILWAGISTNITQFLLSMWQQGALRGASAEEAFYVKCDADNNTEQAIANGQVNIEVGVALQYPAEFVVIRIGQWQGGSTATVTV